MALVKDELGLEVDEEVLKLFQDPKFATTETLLSYRERRKAKEKENADAAAALEEEKKKPKGLFGLSSFS